MRTVNRVRDTFCNRNVDAPILQVKMFMDQISFSRSITAYGFFNIDSNQIVSVSAAANALGFYSTSPLAFTDTGITDHRISYVATDERPSNSLATGQ